MYWIGYTVKTRGGGGEKRQAQVTTKVDMLLHSKKTTSGYSLIYTDTSINRNQDGLENIFDIWHRDLTDFLNTWHSNINLLWYFF